jgi:nucleoside-diphosphate-sugar epimerase
MKKVLVIGGTGFLGRHLLAALKAEDFSIYAVQHKRPFFDGAGLTVIPGGIRAINCHLINAIRPDVIFHLARPVLPYFKNIGRWVAAQLAAHNNQRLISELRQSEARPLLLFASGSLMYGNSDRPHNETAALNPLSYARQYVLGEMPLIKCVATKSYPLVLIRLPWLLGCDSWFKWFYLDNIFKNQAIPAFGNMSNMMEIIDINDAARLMIRIARRAEGAGIYNICSQGAVSQQQFTETIAGVFSVQTFDYKKLLGKTEQAALEAFQSSIRLSTIHPEIFRDFNYAPLKKSLLKIRDEANYASGGF